MTSGFLLALQKERFPVLDGFRALAVGVVIAYHGGLPVAGDLGVTGFFVLSGFLITWLLFKEQERNGTVSLRGFYMRRTLRIVPAYVAFVIFSISVDTLLGQPWSTSELASAATYTVNYLNVVAQHSGPIPHAWSLAVEEQFYLLWPLGFLFLARYGRRITGYALLGAIGTVVAWRSIAYLVLDSGPHYAYNAFETRADSLAIGCLLATVAASPRFHRVAAIAGRWSGLPIFTAAALYLVRTSTSGAFHYSVGFTLESLLLALLLVQLLELHGRWVARWMDWRPVAYLGAISYPLYLWHMVGFAAGERVPQAHFAVGVLASIVLAAGSYHFLEQPVLRLKARMAARPRFQAAPTWQGVK